MVSLGRKREERSSAVGRAQFHQLGLGFTFLVAPLEMLVVRLPALPHPASLNAPF